jgi:BirA family transcriptional regulator, biotin operon repressor / biotin---[acetyl-CoA-carboxylase] ligase
LSFWLERGVQERRGEAPSHIFSPSQTRISRRIAVRLFERGIKGVRKIDKRRKYDGIWYHLPVTEILSPSLISRGLKTRFFGRKIVYYPVLPSTMDAARQAARNGTPEGTVVIAGEQTAGKGRLNRAWLSPPGNIAMSIVLYPDIARLPYLVMIASLAVVYALEKTAGVKGQIKWPNDVLVDGKKVGGILIENEMKGNKVAFSTVGVGINVDLDVAAYPEIAATATGLRDAPNDALKIKIIRSLLAEFERLYIKLPDGQDIFEAWRDRLVTLGKKVRATSANEVIEGIAQSVDESGALYIRGTDGNLTKVVAGDVTLAGEIGRG